MEQGLMRLLLTATAPDDKDPVDYTAQVVRWARYYGFTVTDVQLVEDKEEPMRSK